MDMEKKDGYPHNEYPTDIDTGTRRIFIQQIRYGGVAIHTLSASLISLAVTFKSIIIL